MRQERSKRNIERIVLQRRKARLLNYLFRRSFLFRLSFIVRISFILFFLGIYFFGNSYKTNWSKEKIIYSNCYDITGYSMRTINKSKSECFIETDRDHFITSDYLTSIGDSIFVNKNVFGHPLYYRSIDSSVMHPISSRFSNFYFYLFIMTCISLPFIDITIPKLKQIFIITIAINSLAFLFYISYGIF